MTSLYIHIPYCKTKCSYCDFLSFPSKSPEKYVKTLLNEIKALKPKSQISTVYIGGGTPTALPSPLLCKILNAAAGTAAEVTVEANPGTLTPEYLKALKANGANRLSIGLQTTQPALLKSISRIHSYEEFLQNYHAACQAGFENINIDLMFALPNQTLENWQETLEQVTALKPRHISAYSLTPAENTPLWQALEDKTLKLPSDEIDRQMYHYARRFLAEKGYTHYEISNFAIKGFESQHNLNCWKRVPYIGLGLGASSFDGSYRWRNTENMEEYLSHGHSHGHTKDIEKITPQEAVSESIILGLRLTEGINESLIPKTHTAEVETLTKNNLLTRKNKNICLTEKGLDLANQVFERFIT